MAIRPPLQNMLFPVQRPCEDITAEWDLFLFILPKRICSKISIFLTKKKEIEEKIKDIAASRLATISATRWTGNKLFFKDGLSMPLLV